MPKRRSKERQMLAFRRRLDELLRKEARCPKCKKLQKQLADAPFRAVCDPHQRLRCEIVFGK